MLGEIYAPPGWSERDVGGQKPIVAVVPFRAAARTSSLVTPPEGGKHSMARKESTKIVELRRPTQCVLWEHPGRKAASAKSSATRTTAIWPVHCSSAASAVSYIFTNGMKGSIRETATTSSIPPTCQSNRRGNSRAQGNVRIFPFALLPAPAVRWRGAKMGGEGMRSAQPVL